MAEFESLSRGWDHLGNIERTLGDLQGSRTTIYELIQNADDARGATRMRFVVTDEALEVWNDGIFDRCSDVTSGECEWLGPRKHRCDFHSFRKMASGDKRNRPGTTGAFGVGFTAVYQFTDRPELFSNGEHWIVDEMAAEQDRIQRSRTAVDVDGTLFRLPWATERSAFRERVRQEPVRREAIDTFIDELRAAIPAAMPFLKKLRAINAVSGSQDTTFERRVSAGKTSVVASDGHCFEWLVLVGDFAELAATLKKNHQGVIEEARSPELQVAVPVGGETPSGVLYATLPTEEPAHLPVLVHADFVPASDRKRIRFDTSPVSEWNRAAIRAAARVLAENLEAVAMAIGDVAFVKLLLGASGLSKRSDLERIDPAFAAFWDEIARALDVARVTPITTGGHGTVGSVRLWSEDAELAAADVLHDLGVELVNPRVRAEWFQLRGHTAIRVLNLTDVATALKANGLTSRWVPSDRTDALSEDAGLEALWTLLNMLLEVRDRSTQEARNILSACAVAPGWDGAIWPIDGLHRAGRETQDLLADTGVATTFFDLERLDAVGLSLAQMVPGATPSLVLSWVEDVFREDDSDVDEATRLELLRWFFKGSDKLDANDSARLAQLPIFPTATGPRPLVGLALPGDFKDELGLARVVAIDGIEEMRPFLGKLGAPRLTFARYCSDFVVDAVKAGELDESHRRRLLALLATRLSEVQDDASVRAALQPLDLVPCTDGEWRPGDDVYLSRTVRSVVGDDVHFAAIPIERRTAHEDLFRWLGAADLPRPVDVERRCHQLLSGPPGHRETAEAIVRHVDGCFAADASRAASDYAGLRGIPWLPAEGDRTRGHAPMAVYTIFRKTLFASQAKFVDLSRTVQQDNADFLKWLGVESEPTPKQVVDHLLWSAECNEPVREDMWIYLDQNASDPALDALRGKRCLLIAETNTYVKPTEVYWQWHPFGRFRHQLGPKFAEYEALLNRLGVAQRPHPSDAVDVLQEVAARHGGEPAPLLEDDVRVVHACWRLLSEGLDEETLASGELEALATAEVVLDARTWLRRPGDVFFRDSHSLADRFGFAVHERLIDRPEGLWRALSAAGVRNLSDAVESRIVEQHPAGPGGVVADRLVARRRLLLRVLAAGYHDAMRKLEAFDEDIELHRLSRLVIQQALSVDDQLHVSEAYERGALFLPEKQAILYVDAPGAAPVWVEIAREVSRALGVGGVHASGVAAAIKGLLGADTDDAARAELDELGFPALDETIVQDAEPNIVDDLGGAPADRDDDVNDGDEEVHDDGALDGAAEQTEETARDGERQADRDGAARSDQATTAGDDGADNDGQTPTRDGHRAGGGTSTSAPLRSGEEGSGHGTVRAQGSRASSVQSRLRSYVAPVRDGTATSADGSNADGDPEVERAGVDAVLDFERAHGREPEEMPPNHPGFDIRSVDSDGTVRVIEVKATAAEWGPRGVAISSTQFATAQQRREEFWLYVVDRALTAPRVHPINDPATKVDQYFFDDGWQAVTEHVDDPERAIPPLLVHDSPEGITGAVPYVDPVDAVENTSSGWVACQDQHRQDSWFAVRIPGDALGMAYRGGLAYVEPIDRDVEDDELVLVVLHEQVDADTGGAVTIRRWRPERDLAGNELALRLWSDGSVEPLTVHRPEAIEVRGIVRGKLRLSDLEALGYC